MADDTTSKFKKMLSFFEGIRDERNTAANTASRIGRAFIMLLDYCANGVAGLYLSKTKDDETTHKLTMGEATVGGDATIRGKVVTDNIHSSDSDGNTSMTGKGWTLKNVHDETGSYSVLAVDNIVVRKKLEAAELEIHRKTYVGAQMIASDWGHKILRVDPVTYDPETGDVSSVSGLTLFTLPVTVDGVERPVAFVGRALSDTETRVELLGDGKGILNRELETTANAFKVYFCESDGTASIEDDLVVGSMGQCQEFNVKARVTHNFQNTYYWGVCVMHGVEDNVLIGGKPTKCVYGVFAHTTKLLTLTSEVSKHTVTCYGSPWLVTTWWASAALTRGRTLTAATLSSSRARTVSRAPRRLSPTVGSAGRGPGTLPVHLTPMVFTRPTRVSKNSTRYRLGRMTAVWTSG